MPSTLSLSRVPGWGESVDVKSRGKQCGGLRPTQSNYYYLNNNHPPLGTTREITSVELWQSLPEGEREQKKRLSPADRG